MGARHVEDLFSAACDGALSPAERRRYDEHLAGCPQCAAAADEFRQAVDAVRALPAARMPVRVVLPATPPVPAAPVSRWRRLARPPQLSPAWSAGVLALAGVVAVVLLARGAGLHGAGGTSSSAIAHAPAVQFGNGGGGAGQGPGSATEKRAGLGTDSCPLPIQETTTTPGLTAAGGPAGFANRVTVRVPQRPGQELVLATTGSRYAAGSQVLVFAALTTTSSGGRAVVPCVTLEPQQTVALIPSPGEGQAARASGVTNGGTTGSTGGTAGTVNGGTAVAPSSGVPAVPETAPQAVSPLLRSLLTPDQVESFAPYVLERPLAIASPTTQTVGGTLPVQVLTIPAGLAHGTVLRLVALVPAGTPGSGDRPAVEAVLTLEIS